MDIPRDSLTCSVPYICSLSKKVRAGLQVLGHNGDGLKRVVVGLVEQFEADVELKKSLKQNPESGGTVLRQVDIRFVPEGPIQFKTFVSWNWKLNMWHIFVEGANETAFEDGERNW